MLAPIAWKRSWHALNVSASPPAMIDSSPDCARTVPPLTGASSIAMPRAARSSAIGRPMFPSPMNPTAPGISGTWTTLHRERLPSAQAALFEHRRVHAASRPASGQHQGELVADLALAHGIEPGGGRRDV